MLILVPYLVINREDRKLCCQIMYYEGLTVSLEEVTASTTDIILLITRERDGIGEKCLTRKLNFFFF